VGSACLHSDVFSEDRDGQATIRTKLRLMQASVSAAGVQWRVAADARSAQSKYCAL
jgi:hypothetical protein